MDLAHRSLRYPFFSRLSLRVQSLSQNSARLSKRLVPRLIGGLCILGSIGLGAWAYEIARNDAQSEWLRNHAPGQALWVAILAQRRLSPVKDPRKLQSALRTLPSLTDGQASAWFSEEGGWVALIPSEKAEESPSLYCTHCEKIPRDWKPLGTGWVSLESVLSELDAFAARMPKPSRAVHVARPAPSDPREIRY